MDKQYYEIVGKEIIDASIKVHKTLGPGLLESAYQACLEFELKRRGLQVDCEIVLPVHFEGLVVPTGYRIDMLIGNIVIIENKAVEKILPIHEAQILTYLRLSKKPLGYILNWNSIRMVDGIRRKINSITEPN